MGYCMEQQLSSEPYRRGYADALAGKPARPETSDWSRIEPYAEGYEDGKVARQATRPA